MGLNPDSYTAKSMRVTYASIAMAAQVPVDEMNRTGWAPGSRVGSSVYSRTMHERNTAAIMKPELEESIEKVIAHSTGKAFKARNELNNA